MNSPKTESPTLDYRMSSRKYGIFGLIVSLGVIAAGIWVTGHARFPAFIRYTSGPLTLLCGTYFLRWAVMCVRCNEVFETTIKDGIYRQNVPNSLMAKRFRGFSSFEVKTADVNEIRILARGGGETPLEKTYTIVLEDGTRENIVDQFWNPHLKILACLKRANESLIFRDARTENVLKSEWFCGKLLIEAGSSDGQGLTVQHSSGRDSETEA